MQAVGVVDLSMKSPICWRASSGSVGRTVDLFGLQRLHEALGLGVVVGVARAAHADGDASALKACGIVGAGVLHAAVGVVDQTAGAGRGLRSPCRGPAGPARLEMIWRAPSRPPCARRRRSPRPDRRSLRQTDIGDVGDPELVEAGGTQRAQVRRDRGAVAAVVVRDERLGRRLSRLSARIEPEHALGVDDEALVAEPRVIAQVALEAALQRQPLDQVAQVRVVAGGEPGSSQR